jgi:Zn-finger nucleic acid-binding protein
MLCPKCNKNLSLCSKTGAHRCPSCKGYWVDPKLYNTLLKNKGSIAIKADGEIRWGNQPQRAWKLKCPKDESILYTFSYAFIELDYCRTCRGLWFDATEIDMFKANKEQQKSPLSKNSTVGSDKFKTNKEQQKPPLQRKTLKIKKKSKKKNKSKRGKSPIGSSSGISIYV